MVEKDFLWLNIRSLPYFRGLLRAVEARFYQGLPLHPPTLDLGCGDGDFAAVAFERPLEVGLDPWVGPVHKAVKTGAYRLVIQGMGSEMPFPDGYFASALSNSVLEHIPDIDPVLAELARVLQPGAPFIFCVPNHHFLNNLSVSSAAEKLGLNSLAGLYRAFFNRISRHSHCDPPEVWEERLSQAGFRVERWWHYFPPDALHVLEWGHYFGLPSLLVHSLFRRWILVQQRWNLALTRRIVEKHYLHSAEHPLGSYTFYITHRAG